MSLSVSKHASLQHNPLYIDVSSEPRHVYTAGDVIRGVVRCDPMSRPQSVKITFKGICTVYDRSQEAVVIKYFQQKQDLFVSSGAGENHDILWKGQLADGNVELPFEFVFPRTVQNSPPPDRQWSHSGDDPGHPRFQYSPGFLLPPSCAPSANPITPNITYLLEARVDSMMTARRELRYIPPAPEYNLSLLHPNSEFGSGLPKHSCRYKIIRTRKLLPSYKEKTNTLTKVKDFLVDKELFFGINTYTVVPFAKFNICTTPARVAVIGSTIPIHVSIEHVNRSPSIPDPPQISLRRIRVRLIANYDSFVPPPRTTAEHQSPSSMAAAEYVERTSHTITLVDKRFGSLGADDGFVLHDEQDLGSEVGLRLPGTGGVDEEAGGGGVGSGSGSGSSGVVPSFTSYGLTLEHELQVEIWGECATREFLQGTTRDRIQVVAGWTVGHVDEDGGIEESETHLLSEPPPPDGVSPPLYYEGSRS